VDCLTCVASPRLSHFIVSPVLSNLYCIIGIVSPGLSYLECITWSVYLGYLTWWFYLYCLTWVAVKKWQYTEFIVVADRAGASECPPGGQPVRHRATSRPGRPTLPPVFVPWL